MNERELIKELIETIESEINQSNSSYYNCKEGTDICTDVGYIYDWFKEYKKVLKNRYNL